jgi:hypothetical protein
MSKLLMTAFAMGLIVGGVAGGQLAAHKMGRSTTDQPAALEVQLQNEERRMLQLYRENLILRHERAEHYVDLHPGPRKVSYRRTIYTYV